MTKMFTIAGVTTSPEGHTKLRVVNGKASTRISIFKKIGHTDVHFFMLPNPMEKADAYAFVKNLDGNYPNAPELMKRGRKPKSKIIDAVEIFDKKVEEVVEEVIEEAVVVEAPKPLTAEEKLAIKRAKDAARKREKRAAAKANKLLSA